MGNWGQWWQGLTTLNQAFYCGAAFFSVLFIWQMIGSFLGLVDVHDLDVGHPDGGFDHPDVPHDTAVHLGGVQGDASDSSYGQAHSPHEPVGDFKLLTVRSMLAFFTLFTWAGALYLPGDMGTIWSVIYSLLWGFAGMFSVALAMYVLQKMVENGTPNIATCVGTRGVVYLDVPEHGDGEARVLVSGAVSHVKARAAQGQAIKAGTPVRVVRALSSTTIEVEPTVESSQHT